MYDAVTALHYSAYRPPLHSIILERALLEKRRRRIGLDIGCGTGRSTHELANFCNHVIGIEPSKPMLSKTRKQERVDYVNSTGEQIPLAGRTVDVVTLGGSLNYIDQLSLANELVRICRSNAEIVIYDFETNLAKFEEALEVNLAVSSPWYDHSANLSGHSSFDEVTVVKDEVSTNASPLEIAHLLLSSQERHRALSRKYKTSNPVTLIEDSISSMSKIGTIESRIFYSVYSLS